MAARSSLLRLRQFYEAGFRLLSRIVFEVYEKKGGNVGSCIRYVFP